MAQKSAPYYDLETERSFTPNKLKGATPEIQKSAMRHWFNSNYENPANRTPYESREGGYIYIWGGPYDAREELESEFGEFVSRELIEELIQTY